MRIIVSNAGGLCQQNDKETESGALTSTNVSTPRGPHFAVASLLPQLSQNGFALLSGLTHWYEALDPARRNDAWKAFADKNVGEIIRTHNSQTPRYFLNDFNTLDERLQPTIELISKPDKTHLTVVEGGEEIVNCKLLPVVVQEYLNDAYEFLRQVREIVTDVLPTPPFPTILAFRAFLYNDPDLIAGLRQDEEEKNAMRPHVDGSICTLILAQSDRQLLFSHGGNWYEAARTDEREFALVIPGIAANTFGLPPTLHKVRSSPEIRTSITVFYTPRFSGNREQAEAQWSKIRDM